MNRTHTALHFRYIGFIFAGTMALITSRPVIAVEPLSKAHAHNDYWHDRPLFDALDQGFCSVEADVFLIGDQLLVGHDIGELDKSRTLQRLYLDPLKARVKLGNGKVYHNGPTFTLLVDFKSAGKPTYRALENILQNYRDMLCRVESGRYREGAIQVIVSGNRPIDTMQIDKDRLSFVDGRLKDLNEREPHPKTLMPLISDRWTSLFQWRGEGPMIPAEQARLRTFVERAHQNGQRVRFWATPENENVWKELLAAGVDHINTDQLRHLAQFLRDNQ